MKKVISSSVIALILIGLLGGGFFYYKKYRNKSDLAVNAIPPDAAFFIDFYPGAGNLQKLTGSEYFKDNRNEPVWQACLNAITRFDSLMVHNTSLGELLEGSHLLVSAHVTRAADFDLLFLISLPPGYSESGCEEMVRLFTGENESDFQSRNYDGIDIREIELDKSSSFTFTLTRGVFAGSFTSFLVEDAIRQQKVKKPFGGDKAFAELYKNESSQMEDKIYINFSNLPKWLHVFSDPAKGNIFNKTGNFSAWNCFSLHAGAEHISFSGKLISGPDHFSMVFTDQKPVEIKLTKILPANTAAFAWYGMSDPASYFNNLKKYINKHENGAEKERYLNTLGAAFNISIREYMQEWIGREYALVITEPAGSNFDNNVLAFFAASDTSMALQRLKSLNKKIVSSRKDAKNAEENFNGHSIALINLRDIMPALYGDVFKPLGKMFYTSLHGYIVFSNQASSLRNLIDELDKKKYLFTDQEKNIIKKQSSNGNFCLYSRLPASKNIFNSIGSEKAIDALSKWKGLLRWDGFSFVLKHTGSGFETHSYLQYTRQPASGINLLWSEGLDTTVLSGPFFVESGDKQYFIIVQDALNQLYLFDKTGNIHWKKAFNETMSGVVHALDIFKNGQVQFLFNTPSMLHLIDTSGNNISGYPIRLPAQATNGASLIRYNDDMEYRVYLACSNGKVYGYHQSGKPLAGWNFTQPASVVTDPVWHFKRGDQDYLLISDSSGRVYILDKTGASLISVKQKLIKPAGAPFYLDQDQEGNFGFVTIDSSGYLCNIMPDGFIRVHPVVSSGTEYGFGMADMNRDDENDFLFCDGKNIILYQFDSTRIFAKIPGEMAVPRLKIFSRDDEIMVGTWSVESNNIYLFHHDGSLYKGFPVKGSRPFFMEELNRDGRKYILTASGREVLLYILE